MGWIRTADLYHKSSQTWTQKPRKFWSTFIFFSWISIPFREIGALGPIKKNERQWLLWQPQQLPRIDVLSLSFFLSLSLSHTHTHSHSHSLFLSKWSCCLFMEQIQATVAGGGGAWIHLNFDCHHCWSGFYDRTRKKLKMLEMMKWGQERLRRNL